MHGNCRLYIGLHPPYTPRVDGFSPILSYTVPTTACSVCYSLFMNKCLPYACAYSRFTESDLREGSLITGEARLTLDGAGVMNGFDAILDSTMCTGLSLCFKTWVSQRHYNNNTAE